MIFIIFSLFLIFLFFFVLWQPLFSKKNKKAFPQFQTNKVSLKEKNIIMLQELENDFLTKKITEKDFQKLSKKFK